MMYPESFEMSAPGEREIRVTRLFNASRELVFDAFTRPELVKRWMLGPPGWTMPVCEINLNVGGTYRYVWRHEADGKEMGMGGVFREIIPLARIVATGRFDESWYAGESLDSTVFAEEGESTRITMTILYESMEARDTAKRSGMAGGMAMSYSRLEEFLISIHA
jgi:uncharacterized protein YndB with AHSA1/START domain